MIFTSKSLPVLRVSSVVHRDGKVDCLEFLNPQVQHHIGDGDQFVLSSVQDCVAPYVGLGAQVLSVVVARLEVLSLQGYRSVDGGGPAAAACGPSECTLNARLSNRLEALCRLPVVVWDLPFAAPSPDLLDVLGYVGWMLVGGGRVVYVGVGQAVALSLGTSVATRVLFCHRYMFFCPARRYVLQEWYRAESCLDVVILLGLLDNRFDSFVIPQVGWAGKDSHVSFSGMGDAP